MNSISVIVAGFAYFALGGLWFTPLFGKLWATAVGFDRPRKWRPPAPYYIVPLIGCLVSAWAIFLLLLFIHPRSMAEALHVGLIVGLGFGAAITSVNAVSPNMPRPALYALVTGSYHLAGAMVCSAIIYWLAHPAAA